MMDESLKDKLIYLAKKYETADFLQKDPSQFMHRYAHTADKEVVAFIASSLAFGRRDQILSHVQFILDCIEEKSKSPVQWIIDKDYKKIFPAKDESFYRVYSYKTMRIFFDTLSSLLSEHESLGKGFKSLYKDALKSTGSEETRPLLSRCISGCFPKECTIICHGESSAAKRIHMFLRWMVRDDSPVDLGLWKSWYDKKDLLMPLDTHVMQEATKFSLIPSTSSGSVRAASLKTALELTDILKEAFPHDPVRGDFALFGLGVDASSVKTSR